MIIDTSAFSRMAELVSEIEAQAPVELRDWVEAMLGMRSYPDSIDLEQYRKEKFDHGLLVFAGKTIDYCLFMLIAACPDEVSRENRGPLAKRDEILRLKLHPLLCERKKTESWRECAVLLRNISDTLLEALNLG